MYGRVGHRQHELLRVGPVGELQRNLSGRRHSLRRVLFEVHLREEAERVEEDALYHALVPRVRRAVQRQKVAQTLSERLVLRRVRREVDQDERFEDVVVTQCAGEQELGDALARSRLHVGLVVLEERQQKADHLLLRKLHAPLGVAVKFGLRRDLGAAPTQRLDAVHHDQVKQTLHAAHLDRACAALNLVEEERKSVECHLVVEQRAQTEAHETLLAHHCVLAAHCRYDQLRDQPVERRVVLQCTRHTLEHRAHDEQPPRVERSAVCRHLGVALEARVPRQRVLDARLAVLLDEVRVQFLDQLHDHLHKIALPARQTQQHVEAPRNERGREPRIGEHLAHQHKHLAPPNFVAIVAVDRQCQHLVHHKDACERRVILDRRHRLVLVVLLLARLLLEQHAQRAVLCLDAEHELGDHRQACVEQRLALVRLAEQHKAPCEQRRLGRDRCPVLCMVAQLLCDAVHDASVVLEERHHHRLTRVGARDVQHTEQHKDVALGNGLEPVVYKLARGLLDRRIALVQADAHHLGDRMLAEAQAVLLVGEHLERAEVDASPVRRIHVLQSLEDVGQRRGRRREVEQRRATDLGAGVVPQEVQQEPRGARIILVVAL